MRKIILAAFLLLVSVSFVSCNFAKRELKAKIEMANRECPVELGSFGKIENIKYDLENDEVVMTITYNGTVKLDLSALNKIKGPVKRGIMNDFVNNKDRKTRSHTDGFRKNNVKCLKPKGICSFVPNSSAYGF